MNARPDLGAIAPHDEARSAQQIAWLRDACQGRRVLDLGCGEGRIASVIASEADRYLAVDHDPTVLAECRAAAPDAEVQQADFLELPETDEVFDDIVCLGNTFCLVWEVSLAVRTLRHWRDLLADGGRVILDDIPQDLWPEVVSGNWINGLSEDGQLQLCWKDDDAVMAIRSGEAVDPSQPTLTEDDCPMRLWTRGALELAAQLAGFDAPEHHANGGVLVLRSAQHAPPV